MEEELKKIKTKIRKVKKHCDTWIKHTGDDEIRDIYIKIYNMLDEIVRN
jgi:uncharacterized FlaG/YvyC family protein